MLKNSEGTTKMKELALETLEFLTKHAVAEDG